MIDLLKRELPSHYKLHRTIVDVPYEITAEEHFDLTDRGLTSIVDDDGGHGDDGADPLHRLRQAHCGGAGGAAGDHRRKLLQSS